MLHRKKYIKSYHLFYFFNLIFCNNKLQTTCVFFCFSFHSVWADMRFHGSVYTYWLMMLSLLCLQCAQTKCIVNIILLWMQSTVMWMNQISALFFLTDWTLVHFYIYFCFCSCCCCCCYYYTRLHSLVQYAHFFRQQIQFHDKDDVPPIYNIVYESVHKDGLI